MCPAWQNDHLLYGTVPADLLERVSPYFLNSVQIFGVIIVEAIVFLALIAFVYRRQEI